MRPSLPSSLHPRPMPPTTKYLLGPHSSERNAVKQGSRVPVRTLAPLQPAARQPLLQRAGAGNKNHSSQQPPRRPCAAAEQRLPGTRAQRRDERARGGSRLPSSVPAVSAAEPRRPRALEPAPQRVSDSAPAAAGALPPSRARVPVPEPPAASRSVTPQAPLPSHPCGTSVP